MSTISRVSRRRLVALSPLALAMPTRLAAQSQPSTPEPAATPVSGDTGPSLAEQVLAIDPQDFLDRLLTTPVEPAAFPADAGAIGIEPWEDDADVEGTVGAVILSGTGVPLLGAVLVFPDAQVAGERVRTERANAPGPVADAQLLGISGATVLTMFGPVTYLPVGYALVWGWGFPSLDEAALAQASPAVASEPTAEPGYIQRLELRSITHAIAVLSHVQTIVSGETSA